MDKDKLVYRILDEVDDPYLTELEIRRLMRWMTPGSPIWKAANALVTKTFSDLDSPEFYLKVLTSPHWRRSSDRLIAVDALRLAYLSPEQAVWAEAVLCKIVANKQAPGVVRLFLRILNMLRRLAGTGLLATFAFAILNPMLKAVSGIPVVGLLYDVFFLCVLGLLSGAVVTVPIWSLRHDAKRELRLRQLSILALEWGGPGCIETLASAASTLEFMRVARLALRNVLTRLEPSDYGKVSALGLEKLTALFNGYFVEGEADTWVHLILDALGKVGTGACVASVEAVAEHGREADWREQARRILPILLERQRLERDSSRLLRPAAASDNDDTLLRPVTASASDTEESLLRAVSDVSADR